MKVFDNSWRAFVMRGLVLCAAVFGTVRLAIARDGVAGGPARSYVTVAGTLTGVSGATPVTFEFRRTSAPMIVLCAPQVRVTPGAGGTFSVPVPLDQPELPSTARCPDDLFDGRDVQVHVLVGGTEVATAPINPVPYAHYASVAGVARQYGMADCPVGYERITDTFFTPSSDRRLCQKSRMDGAMRIVYDEVVRVGVGASSFWIDRFEATVFTISAAPTTMARGGACEGYGDEFPPNGEWITPLFAESRGEGVPARCVTWFQASEMCRLSGKRLPQSDEWIAAARGTLDPIAPDGRTTGGCRTAVGTLGSRPRDARDGVGCVSAWGARDMIGNVAEWTLEWQAGLGQNSMTDNATWPDSYGLDLTSNIISGVEITPGMFRRGIPAGAQRGGDYLSGTGAGRYAVVLGNAPSDASPTVGFRCVIPR